jgi:glycosyltransferase involved in cell wall biosynthesis
MKRIFLALICIASTTHTQEEPLLAIVIMVKNEAPFIQPTLLPYVNAGIDSFVVLDTGSTDDTIATTRAFFDQHRIKHGYIFKEPFVDFATSRNRALDLAEKHFPQATFFLMPDAEWYLENIEGLLEFCKKEAIKTSQDIPHSYLIKIFNNALDFYQHRLLRRSAHLRFIGVVHETISQGTPYKVPDTSYFRLGSSRQGHIKSKQRWHRDKELLLREHLAHPNDTRTTFYLAQTYDCLGELENAYTYYKKRTEQAGWVEEHALTYYRLGKIITKLHEKDPEQYLWKNAFDAFLMSYSLRSCRAEPLIEIARHYLKQGDHALAYLFIRRAVELPYPTNEILFVEKQLYKYDRYDICGQSAWYNGAYELGEWAVKNALAYAPHVQHLHYNLQCYHEYKKSQKG